MARPTRLRILVGTIVLVGSLTVGALLVMWLGATLVPDRWYLQLVFYALAGTLWVFPAAKLTAWMQQENNGRAARGTRSP